MKESDHPYGTAAETNASLSISGFLEIALGLAAVVAAVHFLNIEINLKLIQLLYVVAGGFVLYAFAPLTWRLPLLGALNVAAMFVLLTPVQALLLLGFALLLFAILNLSASVTIRSVLIVAIGLLFALFRMDVLPFAHGVILPILGSLFMFRTILFLHEQRFVKKQADIWLRLNYFLLLPNLVFFIFPVVDYKTFIGKYYSKPALETYRKGILMMANGVFHFFIYRLIYYYLVPNPAEIFTVFDWLQFIIASYALIVRLAGIFHFSAGVICLFGFDLPPTFNHYFFADSFSDLWRRINMYWRDFMMKVFYYPIYFKLKHLGTINAIALSILITFVFNWFLHAYQWFWLRGSFLYTIQDITFWAVFGIVVMLNSVYMAKAKKKKSKISGFPLKASVFHVLRVIGIFMFMAFLWSWWITPSIPAWFSILTVWSEVTFPQVATIIAGLALILIIGTGFLYLQYRYERDPKPAIARWNLKYPAAILGIWLMALIGFKPVSNALGDWLDTDMEPVLTTQLNEADRDMQFKGYYENILSTSNNLIASPLSDIESQKPDDWEQLHNEDVLIKTNDLITKELMPDIDIKFKGSRLTSNSLGLRDRPMEKERSPGTLRMIILGGSIEMGSGVEVNQTYENIFEDMLNEEDIFKPYQRVEIVNFAVSGIHLPQHIARVDQWAADYDPQVIIYTAHTDEINRIMTNLYYLHRDTIDLKYRFLKRTIGRLDLPRNVSETGFWQALRPHMRDVIAWGLKRIKRRTERMGAVPVWMFVPTLDGKISPKQDERLLEQAKDLGYEIIDLRGFKGDLTNEELMLRPWDTHPGVQGHRLKAEKWMKELKKNEDLIQRILDGYESN